MNAGALVAHAAILLLATGATVWAQSGPVQSSEQPYKTHCSSLIPETEQNRFDIQSDRIIAMFAPRERAAIERERERVLLGKGQESSAFWQELKALQREFDTQMIALIKEAGTENPEEAACLYLHWAHSQQFTNLSDDQAASEYEAAAGMRSLTAAATWVMERLEVRCKAGGGTVHVLTQMVAADRMSQLLGGDSLASLSRLEDCRRNAKLLIDFDSTIEATNFLVVGKVIARVRGDRIELSYNSDQDVFRSNDAKLEYVSVDFKPSQSEDCTTVERVSGTASVTAKRLTEPNQPDTFMVQIFPKVSENITYRLARSEGCRAASPTQSYRIFSMSFGLTDGLKPFKMDLGTGDTRIITGDWQREMISVSQNTIVTLYTPIVLGP